MSEYAGQTWGGMVQGVADEYGLPEPTLEEVDYILWEWTAFPFASPEHVERQVRDYMGAAVHR